MGSHADKSIFSNSARRYCVGISYIQVALTGSEINSFISAPTGDWTKMLSLPHGNFWSPKFFRSFLLLCIGWQAFVA